MTLAEITEKLQMARRPEEIFGEVKEARKEYLRLAKLLHPDTSHAPTDRMFVRLEQWWTKAQARMVAGTYGSAKLEPVATLRTATAEYTLFDTLASGDICDLYICEWSYDGVGICKVARNPRDNDLVRNEATMLHEFNSAFMPRIVDKFLYQTADRLSRQVNILTYPAEIKSPLEWYTLRQVREHYRYGVDPKDMAWMWRRLLMALDHAHRHDVIHGAVLPTHVLIHPGLHGLTLIDWSYAVRQRPLRAISAEYERWYPPEVFTKDTVLPGLDIFMAARCMIDVLGGDPLNGRMPEVVPMPIRAFFKGCLLSPRQRPQDAFQLREEFEEVLERLYGRRRFHEFVMPDAGKGV